MLSEIKDGHRNTSYERLSCGCELFYRTIWYMGNFSIRPCQYEIVSQGFCPWSSTRRLHRVPCKSHTA